MNEATNIYSNLSNQTKFRLHEISKINSSYFQDKNHFGNDGSQNYLVFQPMCKYFKMIGNTHCISKSKYKGLSDEITEPPTTSDNSLAPTLSCIGKKTRVKFNESCLK